MDWTKKNTDKQTSKVLQAVEPFIVNKAIVHKYDVMSHSLMNESECRLVLFKKGRIQPWTST